MPLLFFLYPWFRLVMPLPLPLWSRLLIGLLFLVISLKQQFFIVFGGGFFDPELPGWLIELYGAAYTILVLLLFSAVARDILLGLSWLGGRFWGLPALPALSVRGFIVLCCLCSLTALYGLYEALKLPEVHSFETEFEKLPSAFDGYRIVQLSDLHLSASRGPDWAEEVFKRAMALSPDLILLTGDFIDGSTERRALDIVPLKKLRARDGVYGILGNHEYYFDGEAWRKKLEDSGITMLVNENRIIKKEGSSVAIAGTADLSAARFGLEAHNTGRALAGAEDSFRILLDHNPKAALENAKAGAQLQLSGHTHGGMMPLLSTIVKAANGGFVKGLYRVENMTLYVSPGTGIWNGFLVRLGAPAEITLITLRKKKPRP